MIAVCIRIYLCTSYQDSSERNCSSQMIMLRHLNIGGIVLAPEYDIERLQSTGCDIMTRCWLTLWILIELCWCCSYFSITLLINIHEPWIRYSACADTLELALHILFLYTIYLDIYCFDKIMTKLNKIMIMNKIYIKIDKTIKSTFIGYSA